MTPFFPSMQKKYLRACGGIVISTIAVLGCSPSSSYAMLSDRDALEAAKKTIPHKGWDSDGRDASKYKYTCRECSFIFTINDWKPYVNGRRVEQDFEEHIAVCKVYQPRLKEEVEREKENAVRRFQNAQDRLKQGVDVQIRTLTTKLEAAKAELEQERTARQAENAALQAQLAAVMARLDAIERRPGSPSPRSTSAKGKK